MFDDEAHSAAPLTWIAAAFVAAACAVGAHVGADARWLAAIGALVAQTRALPHDVAYAAAPSFGWHDAPAFGQLVFHGLEASLGDRGLVLAQLVAVAVALTALSFDLRNGEARDGAAALVICAIAVAAPAALLVVRAELYSLALFPVLLLLLRSEARYRSERIWLVVPLLALWANLHGGALVGFGALAVYLCCHRALRAPAESCGVLAAGGLALLATPAGFGSVRYYSGILHGQAAAQHYGVWAPLSLGNPLDLAFIAVAVALVASAVRARPAVWELVLLAVLAVMSIEARRNGLWLVLAAATPAACSFGESRSLLVPRRLAYAALIVPLAVAAIGVAHPVRADAAGEPLLARATAAAEGTPILADAVDAEQLALQGTRIWIGNPLDAFPADEQRLYIEWLRGTPAGDAILRNPIRVVLVLRGSAPQRRIAGNPAFREIARDGRAVLYSARA